MKLERKMMEIRQLRNIIRKHLQGIKKKFL